MASLSNIVSIMIGSAGFIVSLVNLLRNHSERIIRFINKSKRDVWVHVKSADDDLGCRKLAPGRLFSFTFKPNVFGRTHYWALVYAQDPDQLDDQADGCHLPVYNEGAPNENNVFYFREDGGIYLNDTLFRNFLLN